MKKTILLIITTVLFAGCNSRDEDSKKITSEGINYEIDMSHSFTACFDGVTLTTVHPIRAIREFIIESPEGRSNTVIKKGQRGGFIEKKENLAGNAWIYPDAVVIGNAKVYGNALVGDRAIVYGNAKIYEYARLYESPKVYGSAEIYGRADIYGRAEIFGTARVGGARNITEGMIDKGTYE